MKKRKSSKNLNRKFFIEGQRIYLREVSLADVDRDYCRWMNDTEITQYLESRFEKWSIKKLKDYVKKVKNDPDYLFLAIISKESNKHIGNIKLGLINQIHNFADVGIMIGKKSFWGKGYATEAIKLVVNYAFNTLNLHKLTAGAYANNIGSIKAFQKAGFLVEGRRKKHFCSDGNYVDGILLGIIHPSRK